MTKQNDDQDPKFREDAEKEAARMRKKKVKEEASRIFASSGLPDFSTFSIETIQERSTHSKEQGRAIVDQYYTMQKFRKRAAQQTMAVERQNDILVNASFTRLLLEAFERMENKICEWLEKWVEDKPLCQWAMSNHGIGSIITAGLYSHIDFETCTCKVYANIPRHKRPPHECPGLTSAGQIQMFAGMYDPKVRPWKKGTKRPYNAALKQICWNMGECICRTHNSEKSFYGRLYEQKKAYYQDLNDRGAYAEDARAKLDQALKNHRTISPEQREAWEKGRLQPIGIERMARRYAVTIFLSHYFHVGQEFRGKGPVEPWVIRFGGHKAYIPPPNWKDGKLCLPPKAKKKAG